MRAGRPQEVIVVVTTRIARREIRAETTGPAVDAVPLRVVEDIEPLRAKLDRTRFGEGEVLEQAHLEVGPLRVV
jgi:hypothetical protein